MTRIIHDQFSKDYLEALLQMYGVVEAPSRVKGEARQIDVFFTPSDEQKANLEALGLLGRLAEYPAIFEPYRNPADEDEICDCILKSLEVRGALRRKANREKTNLSKSEIPKLWVLTPTASAEILSDFCAKKDDGWVGGVYFMPKGLRAAIVVIHQLPKTLETLWLRILGRGNVQKKAIDELIALPADNPFKQATLESLYNLQQNLVTNQTSDNDDRELVMRLAPLYQQDREKAKQEGIKEGRVEGIEEGRVEGEQLGKQRLVIRLLNRRFGEIDTSLLERVRSLSTEKLEDLGEALLDFSSLSDLQAWLNQEIQ
jgi:Domain of unknown function (DUF4351)